MMPTRRTSEPAASPGKRDLQRAQRCQRFVEVAERLFLERGFAGTSVNEVVRLAGGSLATLYAEFSTKEALFEAVMSRRTANLFSHAPAGRRGKPDLEAELRTLAKRFLDHMLTADALAVYRLAVHEGPKFESVRRAVLTNGLDTFLARLAGYFASLAAEQRAQIDDPRRAAADFLSLVQGQLRIVAACGAAEQITARQRADHVRHAVRAFLRIYPPAA